MRSTGQVTSCDTKRQPREITDAATSYEVVSPEPTFKDSAEYHRVRLAAALAANAKSLTRFVQMSCSTPEERAAQRSGQAHVARLSSTHFEAEEHAEMMRELIKFRSDVYWPNDWHQVSVSEIH